MDPHIESRFTKNKKKRGLFVFRFQSKVTEKIGTNPTFPIRWPPPPFFILNHMATVDLGLEREDGDGDGGGGVVVKTVAVVWGGGGGGGGGGAGVVVVVVAVVWGYKMRNKIS
ncbi:hypothetical protein L1987_87124 [Smallanthus sonchifolius]|nr:hypothetical protein L1987_87124 [Smallanthus sonchifolius]